MVSRLTLIIAAYNEEANIANCIECLLRQTLKDFDIIIVDDGSKDNTANIIKKYVDNYPHIHYIYQENSGASAARENALNQVRTKYISFLDADDLLSKDALFQAVNKAEESKSNIVLFNQKIAKNEKNDSFYDFKYTISDDSFSGERAFFESILEWGVHGFAVYEKGIFLKGYEDYHLLNKDNSNFVNNDEIITRLCFLRANKISKCNGIHYYQYNKNSTTKRINNKYYLLLENTILLKEFCDARKIEAKLARKLGQDVFAIFNRFKKNATNLDNADEWKNCIERVTNNLLFSKDFFKLTFKEKRRILKIKIHFTFS